MKPIRRKKSSEGEGEGHPRRNLVVSLWIGFFGLVILILGLLPTDRRPAPLRFRRDRHTLQMAAAMEGQQLWHGAADIYEALSRDPASSRDNRAKAAARLAEISQAKLGRPDRALAAFEMAYYFESDAARKEDLRKQLEALRNASPVVPASAPPSITSPAPASPAPGATVVANIGSRVITAEEILYAWKRYFPEKPPESATLTEFSRDYLEEALLSEAARANPAMTGAEHAMEMRFVEGKILAQAMARSIMPQIDDAAAQAAYDADHTRFEKPAGVKLAHIVVLKPEEAEEAGRRLKAGEEFRTVAGAMSLDRDNADLGWVNEGDAFIEHIGAVPSLARRLTAYDEGTTTGPITSPRGLHWIKIERKRAASRKPFSEVSAEVKKELQKKQYSEAREKLLKDLKQSIPISLHLESLGSAIQKAPPTEATNSPQPPAPAHGAEPPKP